MYLFLYQSYIFDSRKHRMKNLTYKELKKKLRESEKKDFYKLLFVIYWPTGVIGIAFALWIRFSFQVKALFKKK